MFRRRPKDPLLELDDVEQRLKPLARVYLGVRAVPLDHVVGTDSKAGAFTREVKPRHSFTRERLENLHQQRRESFPSCGCPPLTETAETIAAEASAKRRLGAKR